MTTPPFDPATPGSGPSDSPTSAYRTFSPVAPEPELVPVSQAPARRSAAGSSRVLNLALGLAVLVAVGGVAFAVGRATAPATAGTAAIAGQNGTGTRGNGFPGGSFDPNGGGLPGVGDQGGVRGDRPGIGGFGGGLTITGTVDAVSAESITIKLESGQTVTVGLDGSTTYHQQADAAASDVTAGTTVQLQLSGGFRPGQNGNGNGNGNGNTGSSTTLGTAGSVTIVP